MSQVNAIKLADRFIGSLIVLLLYPLKLVLPRYKGELKNILVIQLWGIGETILTLPAIKAIREKYPKARISILATKRSEPVYQGIDFIHDIIVIETNVSGILKFMLGRFRKFDIAVDMEEYLNISTLIAFFVGRSRIGFGRQLRSILLDKAVPYNDKQHVVDTHMDVVRLIGAEIKVDELVRLHYGKEDESYVDNLLKGEGIHRDLLVGFGMGVAESAKSRMWPLHYYAALGDVLHEKYGAKMVIVGSPPEVKDGEAIRNGMKHPEAAYNFAGKTSVKQLFCLIDKCSIFVGNDSGPMHIAAAQGVKTVGLFGPNFPVRWGPYGKGNKSIYRGDLCHEKCRIHVHKGIIPECHYGPGNNRCMKAITIEEVAQAVDKLKT